MMMSASQQLQTDFATMDVEIAIRGEHEGKHKMIELELTEEELEAMDIRAIWLEMLAAEENQDRERMTAAIARMERLEAATGTAQVGYARGPYLTGDPEGSKYLRRIA
jgi:hypothetical protein